MASRLRLRGLDCTEGNNSEHKPAENAVDPLQQCTDNQTLRQATESVFEPEALASCSIGSA